MIEGHHPRPSHEIVGHQPHEPHGPGEVRPHPEGPREMEMRTIAEDLVNALESEDRGSKVEAVFGVLNRFELKKPHHPEHPKPHHPRPSHEHPEPPVPHHARPGEHPLPPEPGEGHPRPPAPPRP